MAISLYNGKHPVIVFQAFSASAILRCMRENTDIVLPDLLPPSEDGVFKALLTHPNAKPVLMDLVSSTLALPVADVAVVGAEPPISHIDEKRERFDVSCRLDDGSQVDVEMQSVPMSGDSLASGHANIKARAIYNLCDLHSSQDGRGIAYSGLVRSFQVMFCGYTVFPEPVGFVRRFSFRDEGAVELIDTVGIVFVELTKLKEAAKKPVDEMAPLEMWGLFFAHASEDGYKGLIAEMTKARKEIKMATDLLASISKDDRERALYRSRKKFEMDLAHNHAVAREEGIAEGERIGRMENARRMKADGMDLALISKYTGLSIEDIRKS
jgi:predicted transposase/invertase (TIGR01784 family)